MSIFDESAFLVKFMRSTGALYFQNLIFYVKWALFQNFLQFFEDVWRIMPIL